MNDHPQHERFVMTVPEAARKYLGLGRSAAYEAARRGEIPTIRIGKRLLVPIVAIERMLAEACPITKLKDGTIDQNEMFDALARVEDGRPDLLETGNALAIRNLIRDLPALAGATDVDSIAAAEQAGRIAEKEAAAKAKHRAPTAESQPDAHNLIVPGTAEPVAGLHTPQVAIHGSPRSGPMPHNGYRPFDPSATSTAFPDFGYTDFATGVARVHAAAEGTERFRKE